MPDETSRVHDALARFAESVTRKFAAHVQGEPEDQLRGPFERLIQEAGEALGFDVTATGETRLADRMGKPDYAILVERLLAGYAELKAPGTGARTTRFKGHDKEQWERFSALPNVLYSDGNEWRLYRSGDAVAGVRLEGDVTSDGPGAAVEEDARKLGRLLRDFLSWEPAVPGTAAQLAELLAPLCRALRDDVVEAVSDPGSRLVRLAEDWRELLFPNASDRQFADAYAQTVTYALLLARSEGASCLAIHDAVQELRADHALLSKALEVLTDPQVETEIATSLRMLQRVVDRIDPHALQDGEEDPWLYFYEDFLGKYDPKLRKDAGVYYTPRQVVQAQVRLIDDLLRNRLGLRLGFAEAEVVTLDPCVGTGTYLLGVIDHAMRLVAEMEGEGAVPGRATTLAENIHGFEIMVGPYAVAELRVTQALERHRATLRPDAPNIYLTDTLESPTAEPVAPPLFYEPLAREHERALQVKESEPVLVCLGNPPYDRHAADDPGKGGWVRSGAEGEEEPPILEQFLAPVREAGHGVHLKNLYNLYVYFWRWAVWKVFEHETAQGPGIVSFITAASYLRGPGFAGMREHLRKQCDEIWVIDLGGEGRGTRQTENVFAILTPVAIAVAVRYGEARDDRPAVVHYTRIVGSRDEKLARLEDVAALSDLPWEECPEGWQEVFAPAGTGEYFDWPLLADIFPWRHTGPEVKRTWPVAPDVDTLRRRWRALLRHDDRAAAFKETRDRKIERRYLALLDRHRLPAIASLPEDASIPPVLRYVLRSFDRQWLIADGRIGDYLRPVLWHVYSDRQVYVTSQFSYPLGRGPAVTACAHIPDRHHFSGRGGKDLVPLWRDPSAGDGNLHPRLVEAWSSVLGFAVSAEQVFAYVYALLAHPGYTERFFEQLGAAAAEDSASGPRVPVTTDSTLFNRARELGTKLLHLHTYGERFGDGEAGVPQGAARCVVRVPADPDRYPETYAYDPDAQVLEVGEGRFAPVAPPVWEYEVSGLRVVESWLGYRMREPAGRRSSPLDEINPDRWPPTYTTELLKLLWLLEATVALHPEQEELLEAVLAGPLLTADELGPVPDELRRAPDWSRGEEAVQLEH